MFSNTKCYQMFSNLLLIFPTLKPIPLYHSQHNLALFLTTGFKCYFTKLLYWSQPMFTGFSFHQHERRGGEEGFCVKVRVSQLTTTREESYSFSKALSAFLNLSSSFPQLTFLPFHNFFFGENIQTVSQYTFDSKQLKFQSTSCSYWKALK